MNLKGTVGVAGLGGNPYRNGSYEYYLSEPDSFLLASLHSVFIAVAAIGSDTGACPRAIVTSAVNRTQKRTIPTISNFLFIENREHLR